MRKVKTLKQLKYEYWSHPSLHFTPKMIDALYAKYGDKPASSGEALHILGDRILNLISAYHWEVCLSSIFCQTCRQRHPKPKCK